MPELFETAVDSFYNTVVRRSPNDEPLAPEWFPTDQFVDEGPG
ncbi:hypothetical protein ACMTN4_00005 (plasmid) [Rhodococcus globerulus]